MASLNHSSIIKGFEKIVADHNPDAFFFDFLKALKFPATTIKRLKEPNNNRNVATAAGDFALAKQVYFHPSIGGGSLQDDLKRLLADPNVQKNKIRFFLTTDFVNVVAYDQRVDDWTSFAFQDLRENYEFFLPLTGLYEKPLAYAAHPADVKACEKMGRLYDEIRNINHYEKEQLHDLNVFLSRLLFCFFAEDTGIFPIEGQLTKAVESLTKVDGSDMPDFFERLFWILDMSPEQPGRRLESARLAAFPYVNGGLFHEKIRIPEFNTKARLLLIECGRLEWKEISPVIFGSMFQSVMDPTLRHERGEHYTSEKNIFKVIAPLFLDDLKAELEEILRSDQKAAKLKKLKAFQDKLASIVCLDPASGCGNFLIVAYRELKQLELQAVTERLRLERRGNLSLFMDWEAEYSKVSIHQFYGIEIEEFACDVARVSMWLMEHVMKQQFGRELGTVIPSIPLKTSANIVCGNALTTDWSQVVPVEKLTYLISNPPFSGASTMSKVQKQEVLAVFANVRNAGILDFVTAWYKKAADLLLMNSNIECAFVSTNSICQGEQVAPLWETLFANGVRINFAHQTFQWRNEAKDNAGVFCIVVGFALKDRTTKKLFVYETPKSDPSCVTVSQINGYLIEGHPSMIVHDSNTPQCASHLMVGNQPTDGGNLIIEPDELPAFEAIEALKPYIKKLIGSKELLHSLPRFCLWLTNAPESVLSIPCVAERIEKCRRMRLASAKAATRASATTPHLFQDRRFSEPPSSCIAIPSVSSERRKYIPMGFISNDTIVTNLCHIIPDGTLFDFGMLESRMHMTWMRTVCGRLESRYRYSRDLCYNTFPWPKVGETQRRLIENLAQNVLMTREYYPEMTLADLYDPDKMPADLRKAHEELDLAVERLYRKKPFTNDEERLHHLFARYEKLVNGEDDSPLFSEE